MLPGCLGGGQAGSLHHIIEAHRVPQAESNEVDAAFDMEMRKLTTGADGSPRVAHRFKNQLQ